MLELAGVWTQAALNSRSRPAGSGNRAVRGSRRGGLRPKRSPFAKRLLIAEVPIGASRIAQRYERSLSEHSEVRVSGPAPGHLCCSKIPRASSSTTQRAGDRLFYYDDDPHYRRRGRPGTSNPAALRCLAAASLRPGPSTRPTPICNAPHPACLGAWAPAGCALVAFRSILVPKMEERSCGYFYRLPSCLS